jgi:hypothetical protein
VQLFKQLSAILMAFAFVTGSLSSSAAADTLPDVMRFDNARCAWSKLEDVLKTIFIPDSIRNVEKADCIREHGGISGLMINQMVSPTGMEFYEWFFTNWQEINNGPDYVLTFQEHVLSRQSSRISVFVNDKKVSEFQMLQTDDVAQAGSEQIEIVRYYVQSPVNLEPLLYEDSE